MSKIALSVLFALLAIILIVNIFLPMEESLKDLFDKSKINTITIEDKLDLR